MVTLIFHPVKGEMLNSLELQEHKLPKTYVSLSIRVAYKSQETYLPQRHALVRIKFRLWLKVLDDCH